MGRCWKLENRWFAKLVVLLGFTLLATKVTWAQPFSFEPKPSSNLPRSSSSNPELSPAPNPAPARSPAQASTSVPLRAFTISAVGDVMMGTDYPANALRRDGGRGIFEYSKAYFQASDIGFANLEGPLFDGERPSDSKAEGSNRHLFRTPTSYAKWLKDAGITVVSFANNHAMDFGAEGFQSTRNALTNAGIQYSTKSRQDLARFQVNGIRVVLLAADFYPGQRSITQMRGLLDEITQLRRSFDVVIVSAHAGAEGSAAERVSAGTEMYMGENRGDVVDFAHRAIDAGAGLILMHGPHVPRALELYKTHLIVYSMGNFVTERGISIQGLAGLAPLFRIQIDYAGKFVQGEIMSFKQTREYGTIYDPTRASFLKIKRLSELDFPASLPHFESSTNRFYPSP